MGVNWLADVAKGLVSPFTNWIDAWQARKTARVEGEIAVHNAQVNAKIRRLETGQAADIKWEELSIHNSSWKDEFWTLVLAIPMVMCFFPDYVIYIHNGFGALAKTPAWYQTLLWVAVGSAFGVRRFGNFMRLKKGD